MRKMKRMQQPSGNEKAKIPVSVLLTVLVTLVFCLAAIISAITIYHENSEVAEVLLLFGIVALLTATYSLFQMRRRVMRLRIEVPPIMTTIECKKCGFKTVRAFQRGDYVFKEVDACQKCNDKMLITAIYREIKEKDKEKEKTSF
jgi:RNase P subunit RPR2